MENNEVKFCENCGNENPTDANFCMKCGCQQFVCTLEEYETKSAERYNRLVGQLNLEKERLAVHEERVKNLELELAQIEKGRIQYLSNKAREARGASLEGLDTAQIDPLCKKALRFWLTKQHGRASIASIQRALQIGFNRSGRILDTLQELNLVQKVDPDSPSKIILVLVTNEELDTIFPELEDYTE